MSAAITPSTAHPGPRSHPGPEFFEILGRDGFDAAHAYLQANPVVEGTPEPALPLPECAAARDPTAAAANVASGPADMRDNAIIPSPFGGTRRMENADLPLLEVGTSHPPFQPRLIGTLPAAQGTLRNKPWHGIPNIMVPNLLVERAGDDLNIAPPGLRLFLELLMLVPRSQRREPYRLRLRVADLGGWLWPGTGRYRPEIHAAKLDRALIVAHNCRLPWSDGKQDGYWAPVVVRSAPDTRHAESILVVDLEMPPGSHAGPMVYRPSLRRYGAQSAIAWRLTLALAWLWDHYLGGPKAPGRKRLPWLDHDALIRLATGRDMSRVRRRKQIKYRLVRRTQEAIERLQADGNAEVEVNRKNEDIRLLPPPGWRQVAGEGS